jgi:phosphoserine / homoserine phosphotransferase
VFDIVCLDLEGVLTPEIWIEFAELSGIPALRATTRDVPDYDKLMRQRLRLLEENQLGLADVRKVVDRMRPLDGAEEFLGKLRERYQVVVLSDTFYEFADPLMRRLGWPTLFCHHLEADGAGRVSGYRIRIDDHKRRAVQAFKELNFRVAAAGDSYNDTGMLQEADAGFFFRAPANVVAEFPKIPAVESYDALLAAIANAAKS